MKRTDQDRRERELKRARKKEQRHERGEAAGAMTVGEYIDALNELFYHDGVKIYNTETDERILEMLEDMKDDIEERHWESVIRKAVKKSGVKERDKAIDDLIALL